MEQVQENVAKALALDIPHMSLYSLILENHTVFMNRMRRGKLPLPKEELEAEMFEYIIQELERAGFEHYEISNFSKPGFESRHNLMYWDNAEYYGIGAGAYFVIHFGGYLKKADTLPQKCYKAAIICPNGISSSLMIKENLLALFPQIEFIGTSKIDDLYAKTSSEYDMVFFYYKGGYREAKLSSFCYDDGRTNNTVS